MIHTIEQAKRAVARTGSHWFDSDTLRFFGSRISSIVYPVTNGCYFVSSEHTGFGREGRAYSVRFCSDTGQIETVGDFLVYPSRNSAHAAAKRAQQNHDMGVSCAS